MAFDSNDVLSSIGKATSDSLTYNPFASDWQDEPGADLVATARHDPVQITPIRLTPGFGETIDVPIHIQAQTEIYDPNYSESGHLHPLRSAGMRVGPNDDAGITRPHLSRIVNVGALTNSPPIEPGPSSKPRKQVEEKDVLVHEVELGDSLAGVSLKYGISMAELRRANHMWPSDSIHMRKQLYIPLEKANRWRQKDGILISISPVEERLDPLEDPDVGESERQGSVLSDSLSLGIETIRRVPASHLSFFPPASRTKPITPVRHSPNMDPRTAPASHKPYLNHGRHASSPSHSLTSILTALPIAASTRDTIIARLSFDSVSSSYSDQEQIYDRHEGLELNDVQRPGPSNSRDYVNDEMFLGHTLPTPTASFREARSDRSSVHTRPPSPTHVRTLSSSPHSYIPPHAQVRTIQLEPSPEMQLPPSKALRQEGKKKATDTPLLAEVGQGWSAP